MIFGLSGLLVFGAHVWIETRSAEGGSPWQALSPDTREYLRMIAGAHANPPFSYRPVVPLIASWLPAAPLEALALISRLSLWASYALIGWVLLRVVRVSLATAGLTLFVVATTTRALLLVQNPYLTDGFGLLVASAMLALVARDRLPGFGAVAVVGVLAREDALFGAIGLALSKRRPLAVAVAAAAIATWMVPRLASADGVGNAFAGLAACGDWHLYAKIFFAFGATWGLLALGLPLAHERTALSFLWPYAVCVVGGALLSTLFVADATRMFLPVLPILAVAVACVLERVPWSLRLGIALYAGSGLLLGLPNRALGSAAFMPRDLESFYERLAPVVIGRELAGVGVVVACAWVVWRSWHGGARPAQLQSV